MAFLLVTDFVMSSFPVPFVKRHADTACMSVSAATMHTCAQPSCSVWLEATKDATKTDCMLQIQCHSSFQFLAALKVIKPTLTSLEVRLLPQMTGQVTP